MSTSTFSGAVFSVESVAYIGPSTIRIRFTQDPLAVNPLVANDALNPANYTLSGPATNSVVSATAVFEDPQSLDLFTSALLEQGVWTVTCALNMVSDQSNAIQDPVGGSFTVTGLSVQEEVVGGAVDDTPADVIRKHLNPHLVGKAWDALIYAMGQGDQTNWDNAKLIFDQLFASSASGKYLDRKCSDDGVVRPLNIGMSDELFRKFKIKVTTKKLVHQALLEIMEVFYGSDSIRAFVETSLVEPFALSDQDTLDVLIDEKTSVRVIFSLNDFTQISAATALEVATSITRSFRDQGMTSYAVSYKDPQTDTNKVRIYSQSLGLGSAVRVTGGKAQNVLQFSQLIDVYT